MATRVQLLTGYRVEYSGQFESSQQAASLLFWLSIAVVIAMFFILAAASRRALAALIMVNLPLALIGGIAGVFVSGGVLSIASIIGLIALLGIAARNGIMLVSQIEYLRNEEGVTDLRHAVLQGSIDRVVPILMTALCTGLALVPVGLGAGEPGSEIQVPHGERDHLWTDLIDCTEHACCSGRVLRVASTSRFVALTTSCDEGRFQLTCVASLLRGPIRCGAPTLSSPGRAQSLLRAQDFHRVEP